MDLHNGTFIFRLFFSRVFLRCLRVLLFARKFSCCCWFFPCRIAIDAYIEFQQRKKIGMIYAAFHNNAQMRAASTNNKHKTTVSLSLCARARQVHSAIRFFLLLLLIVCVFLWIKQRACVYKTYIYELCECSETTYILHQLLSLGDL